MVSRFPIVSPPAFYKGRDQFVMELAPKARGRRLTVRRPAPPDLPFGWLRQTGGTGATCAPNPRFSRDGAGGERAVTKRFNCWVYGASGCFGFGGAHRTHRNCLAASQFRFGESLKNHDYPWPAIDLLSGDKERPIETQALPAGEPLRPHPQGGH
jgi:hypothetical protein